MNTSGHDMKQVQIIEGWGFYAFGWGVPSKLSKLAQFLKSPKISELQKGLFYVMLTKKEKSCIGGRWASLR